MDCWDVLGLLLDDKDIDGCCCWDNNELEDIELLLLRVFDRDEVEIGGRGLGIVVSKFCEVDGSDSTCCACCCACKRAADCDDNNEDVD
ncbi:unnamed protein product [Anisakis simplex]|uniref:Uncharacterized protein n=1 Tax=Anisakis simplex TaxID=6269 RepID=A0A0M3KBQ9_ANISI|nr:unnamed protein product [Anisakis simplex]